MRPAPPRPEREAARIPHGMGAASRLGRGVPYTRRVSNWTRRYHQPGGGRPLLHYFVFGAAPEALKLTAGSYRTEGIPEGIEVVSLSRESEQGASVFASFTEQETVFSGDLRRRYPDLVDAVLAAPSVVAVSGELEDDPEDLRYLQRVTGVLLALLDAGGVAVMDTQAFRWWNKRELQEQLFEPDDPQVLRRVTLIASPEREDVEDAEHGSVPEAAPRLWMHTRGMRKFGRPDLSMRRVTELERPAVAEMLSRFMLIQAHGGVIPEGQPVAMPGLPDGLRCHHAGHLDDPAFNNAHVEILRPGDSTGSE